ncbi:hypothetical protein AB7M35_000003 [Amorphus suaedae]
MSETDDIVRIGQLIQAWGIYRDQGRWERLASTFAPDGRISVTWFDGSHADFIERCKAAYKPLSPRSKHLIGLPLVRLNGDRAVAETNIQILGRADIAGVRVDNTSHARFLDRIRRGGAGWQIVSRVAIYEKDRFDPVLPSSEFEQVMRGIDADDIPEPYRYLGYRLRQGGRTLVSGIAIDGSEQTLGLLEEAEAWLAEAEAGSAS